jgi:ATP-binding cassette subfamily F protein 3
MPNASEASVRARCAQMGFSGSKAETLISSISGGEKARLLMGLATFGGPHLLILDEPTNHLDIGSTETVEAGLRAYDGALLVVSHDEPFLEAVGTTRRLELPARTDV